MSDPAAEHWDAVVIGTGIGGGTAGRALAEAGMRVLFVEAGRGGHRAEETRIDAAAADPVARAVRGLWPEPVILTQDGTTREVFAPLGAGPGGSSVFFAATLERPERHDLDDVPGLPHPTGGWPAGFDAMRPWFDAAERLYSVRGEADPLSAEPQPALLPPRAAGPADAAILDALRRNGMHPYLLHAALRDLPGCASCFGRKCPRDCKMDARSAGVEPALVTGRAALLDRCVVTRLIVENGTVTGVEALRDGTLLRLTADRIVLAAGALSSPRLLLRSASEDLPDGIGNGAGLVGCNLMFHLNEIVAVFPGRALRGAGPSKAVGFRDLYAVDGQRLGMVQAMGIDAGAGEILHALRQRLETRRLGRTALAREGARLPAAAALRLLGEAKVFVGLLEDLPDAANRVRHDPARPDRIVIDYRVSEELAARRALFRSRIRAAFRGLRPTFAATAPEPNLGHPCGTLRMGTDPATSVLDADCRVHGVANLWCTDASVFPTSTGVNPSLTIAANALRVAATIGGSR